MGSTLVPVRCKNCYGDFPILQPGENTEMASGLIRKWAGVWVARSPSVLIGMRLVRANVEFCTLGGAHFVPQAMFAPAEAPSIRPNFQTFH